MKAGGSWPEQVKLTTPTASERQASATRAFMQPKIMMRVPLRQPSGLAVRVGENGRDGAVRRVDPGHEIGHPVERRRCRAGAGADAAADAICRIDDGLAFERPASRSPQNNLLPSGTASRITGRLYVPALDSRLWWVAWRGVPLAVRHQHDFAEHPAFAQHLVRAARPLEWQPFCD
jgi:hypothetical protein